MKVTTLARGPRLGPPRQGYLSKSAWGIYPKANDYANSWSKAASANPLPCRHWSLLPGPRIPGT